MIPALVADRVDPARDPLTHPVIGVGGEEMAVLLEHLLADRNHLRGAKAGVDPQIAQRAVEAVDVLLQFERPAVKGPGHVEGGVAVFEAAVAKRHDDLALRHDLAVEIGDAVVGASVGHGRSPNSGRRLSANSSMAATSLSASASSRAIDSAIIPRLAIQTPRARRSK